jgi:nucleosome assembly protein 1-like 1
LKIEALESYKEATEEGSDIKGLPNFWLQALSYHPATRDYISEEDSEALQSLIDIQIELNDSYNSFKIVFIFNDNDFFTNKVFRLI